MLASLLIKVEGLKVLKFNKKRLQHRYLMMMNYIYTYIHAGVASIFMGLDAPAGSQAIVLSRYPIVWR